MNPFEDNEESNDNIVSNTFEEVSITVWKESKGRKTNTYITGWNLDESTLKDHIKQFKKANGCNGSLKMNEEGSILQFQGDKISDIIEFMEKKGVNKGNITLKGQ